VLQDRTVYVLLTYDETTSGHTNSDSVPFVSLILTQKIFVMLTIHHLGISLSERIVWLEFASLGNWDALYE
jgi:hypothetical protein